MKIQAIPVSPSSDQTAKTDAQLVRLKVSGPVDPDDVVIRRARELVLGTKSKAMIESFDWALRKGDFVTEE